jgi:hypothetical protein
MKALALLFTTEERVSMSSAIDSRMLVDAHSHHRCPFRNRMWPKHCQPNLPVENPQPY